MTDRHQTPKHTMVNLGTAIATNQGLALTYTYASHTKPKGTKKRCTTGSVGMLRLMGLLWGLLAATVMLAGGAAVPETTGRRLLSQHHINVPEEDTMDMGDDITGGLQGIGVGTCFSSQCTLGVETATCGSGTVQGRP
jgi:hypothetical protein